MLKIAACDDEQKYLHDLERLLDEYGTRSGLGDISAETFTHPFDLSEAVKGGKPFDVFLLDIYMPGMTGIALAQELRRQGIVSSIIFLTTSRDHALEAFGVGATQYLLKPFEQTAFFAAMDAAAEKTVTERRRQVMLRIEDSYKVVGIRDILYAEAQNKNQLIMLTDKSTLTVRMASAKLFELLSQHPDFARCGVAYILNLAHIHSLDTKFALLKDGTSIKIPRGAYPELKDKFFRFFYERKG